MIHRLHSKILRLRRVLQSAQAVKSLIGNSLMDKDPQSPPPGDNAVTGQLEKLLASPHFEASPLQIAFLKFVKLTFLYVEEKFAPLTGR